TRIIAAKWAGYDEISRQVTLFFLTWVWLRMFIGGFLFLRTSLFSTSWCLTRSFSLQAVSNRSPLPKEKTVRHCKNCRNFRRRTTCLPFLTLGATADNTG